MPIIREGHKNFHSFAGSYHESQKEVPAFAKIRGSNRACALFYSFDPMGKHSSVFFNCKECFLPSILRFPTLCDND
jgi:hypothetical protein